MWPISGENNSVLLPLAMRGTANSGGDKLYLIANHHGMHFAKV